MLERIKSRLRRLGRRWAIPPWLLIIWSLVNFGGNVQFLVGAYVWTLPRILGLSSTAQSALLMVAGFTWLAILVTRPEKTLAAADLRRLSSTRLRNYTVELTRRLRSFEAAEMAKDSLKSGMEWQMRALAKTQEEKIQVGYQTTVDSGARSSARAREYKTRFHGDVMALYDVLRERVGDVETEEHKIPVLLNYGMLAGPSPIQVAADYLDRMARRLS